MVKHSMVWIVMADGEHARFVTPASKRVFHTQRVFESPSAHKKSSDLGTDRPTRSTESATGTSHAITPKHDLHEMEKQKFAHQSGRRDQSGLGPGGFRPGCASRPSAYAEGDPGQAGHHDCSKA